MGDKLVETQAHKTRAQVFRDRVKIRLATDEAGVFIQDILKANGVELPGVAWDHVYPNWLIATEGDEVIGCVQVIPAMPMGFIEFLYVDPKASFKMRAIAAKKLIEQATGVLMHAGCDVSISTVDSLNGKFYNVIEKYATPIAEGSVFLKRLKVQH